MNREEAKEFLVSPHYKDLDNQKIVSEFYLNHHLEFIDKIFDQHDGGALEAAIKYAELVEKYEDNVNRYCEAAEDYEKLTDEVIKQRKHGLNMRNSAHEFNSKLNKIKFLVENCSGDEGDCRSLHNELVKLFD